MRNDLRCVLKARPPTAAPDARAAALATLAALACALALAGRAPAAEKEPPLGGRLVCLSARARSSGPILVEVELDWRGAGLIEGTLRIEILEGPETRNVCERPDVALVRGRQRIRLLLPSPGPGSYNSQLEARVTFISDDGVFRLPPSPIFVPRESERSLVVAFSEPRGTPGPETLSLFKGIRLERFEPRGLVPGGDARTGPGRDIMTTPSYMPPEDMPSHPAAWCAFDVAVLAGEGFGLLREKQVDAILAWVRAGGSVLVLPGGGLRPYHARFLNALAGAEEGGPFALSPRGAIEGEGGPQLLRAGLGRAVVSLSAPAAGEGAGTALDGPVWRRAIAFLWKARRAQVDEIARTGEWRTDRERREPGHEWQERQARDGRLRYGRVPIASGSALEETLFPKRIRVIPLWVVILTLALFVAVIGPGDYFVLGLLRRRRLTWLTFPLAAVGFAVFTMVLAEVYMGSADHRNSVTVVDLGRGGRVLRTARYELVVAGRNRDSTTEVAGGFFAPIESDALRGRYGGRRSSDDAPPRYGGLVPARFTAVEQLNQWEPRMNRLLFIGAEAPAVERRGRGDPPRLNLDWDGIDRASWEGPIPLGGLPQVRSAVVASDPRGDVEISVFEGHNVRSDGRTAIELPSKTLGDLCVRPQVGFFSVVSQVAPTGGGDFEDAALLDPTDPAAWLLAAVVRDEQNFTVYRRLFHDGPTAAAGERPGERSPGREGE